MVKGIVKYFSAYPALAATLIVATLFSTAVSGNGIAADSARHYSNTGIKQYGEGFYERAMNSFISSLEFYKAREDTEASEIAGVYSNLGVVSRVLLRYEDAIKHYDTAEVILEDNYGRDHINLGVVYQNQGNILRQDRDFSRALQYYYRGLAIFEKYEENPNWLASLYNNIGLLYSDIGDQGKAIEYYERSLGLRKEHLPWAIRTPAGNLAVSYFYLGNVEESARYFEIAIESTIEHRGELYPGLANNYLNFGLLYANVSLDYEKAMEMYEKALEIFVHHFGERNPGRSRVLMNMGGVHEMRGEYPAALNYFQESLIAISPSFESPSWEDNPVIESVFSYTYLYETLNLKARTLKELGVLEDNNRYLRAGIETYDKALQVLENMRMGYQTEESRLQLSESERDIYPQAIDAAFQIYRKTGEREYLEKGFSFSERSKAAVLLASMRNIEALEFGGVPQELREEEEDIKRSLTAYNELIYTEKLKSSPNLQRISNWEERVFELNRELVRLTEHLEEDYPDYYNLKYDTRLAGLNSVGSRLEAKESLLSYSINDSVLHIFVVEKNSVHWEEVPVTFDLEEKVNTFLGLMNFNAISTDAKNNFSSFSEISNTLYNVLVKPVHKIVEGQNLIFIPDGVLSYLPFELLTSRHYNGQSINYAALPYLLKEHPVSYAYSATIWTETLAHGSSRQKDMIAFAPYYDIVAMDSNTNPLRGQRENLTPLPGARAEATTAAGIFKGKALFDEDASEANFKKLAGDYRFLHLAMHTIIDDENPMFSKLVFTDTNGESGEDDMLNTHEIYNLRLNARLAVLSSCNSGYGKLQKGEGIMSLARGFLYAGVPSIVMTIWEIEDKSGVDIMKSFYSHLGKGKRTDEALRLARLEFIENSDMLRSHPYFWGGYVCIGNPREAVSTSPAVLAFSAVAVILAALIVSWYLKRRREYL